MWIVELGSIHHVCRDWETCVEFRQVSSKPRWIYIGNNVKLEVKGIDTCKVDLSGDCYLILHHVLYTPEIRRNLLYVSVLLNSGFDSLFSRNGVRITLDNVLYGFGICYDCFIILDCNLSTYEYYVDSCVMTCYSSNMLLMFLHSMQH